MVLLALGLTACRTEVYKDQNKVVADDVLRPIAGQQADERISQARALLAQINLAREQRAAGQPVTTTDIQMLLNKVVALVETNSGDARTPESLRSFADLTIRKPSGARKTEYHEVLAWLDRRRVPLRNELTQRLLEKTVPTDKGFVVCVEGVQRQYDQTTGGHFTRLPDKPGSC